MRLTLDVFGDVQLDRELLRYQQRLPHLLEDAGPDLANDFREINTRQFSSEGGNSAGWAPLARTTVARRGSAHPILDDHGDLRRSLTVEGAKGSVQHITSDELFLGTDINYAHYHQTGTSRMPRRRPVEFTETDRRRWAKLVQQHLAGGVPGGPGL